MPAHKGPTAGVGGARLTRFLVEACQSHLVFRIATGFCCAVFVLLTASGKLNQAASIDPYIYAGYTHNYAALLERFGPTYYSERIAYIFPAWAFAYLFGLEGGYFAFRIVALASAVAAVFAIGMRFYGFAPAILAAVWLTFTPWLPRSLLWTYPDGIAVVYLLVGMAFLLVPNSRRLIYHVVAGATFMFAITCNLSLLAIGGLLAPSWAFFYRREGMVWLARAILAVAFGFFATYVALALILYVKFPAYGFSFEFATIREAISLLNGRGQTWYKPLATIIWQEKDFTLLIPITFALAALLLVARPSAILGSAKRDREFAVLAATYLTSIVGFSLILHFGLHDASLSLPWYTVYFVPGCVVALIALAGEAERRGGPIFGTVAVYCGAGLILIWWVAYPILPHLESLLELLFVACRGRSYCGSGRCGGIASGHRVGSASRWRGIAKHVAVPVWILSDPHRLLGRAGNGVGRVPRRGFLAAIRQRKRSPKPVCWLLVHWGYGVFAKFGPVCVLMGLHSRISPAKPRNAAGGCTISRPSC